MLNRVHSLNPLAAVLNLALTTGAGLAAFRLWGPSSLRRLSLRQCFIGIFLFASATLVLGQRIQASRRDRLLLEDMPTDMRVEWQGLGGPEIQYLMGPLAEQCKYVHALWIDGPDLHYAVQFKNVRTLSIGNRIFPEHWYLLGEFKQLESLDLSVVGVKDSENGRIARLPEMPNLKHLEIGYSDDIPTGIENAPRLSTLTLSRVDITDSIVDDIERHPNLDVVTLRFCSATQEQLARLKDAVTVKVEAPFWTKLPS